MIDSTYLDLLERPIICDLATVRPDGSVQVNPMWFMYDEGELRFSHTSTRAKYRNLLANPRMTVLIVDPENIQRYVELRGRLREAIPDPTGAFHQVLGARYGDKDTPAPGNAADRVILAMEIDVVNTR